jgi:hypothetical protein
MSLVSTNAVVRASAGSSASDYLPARLQSSAGSQALHRQPYCVTSIARIRLCFPKIAGLLLHCVCTGLYMTQRHYELYYTMI